MRVAAMVVITLWLAALTFYDVRERRLPNVLTLPGAAVVLAVAAVCGRGPAAAAGAAALAGGYLLVHLVAPTGLGAGDVKLAIGLGALTAALGAGVWALAALAAPLLTAGWGIIVVLRRGERTVAHGPAMCVASATAAVLTLL